MSVFFSKNTTIEMKPVITGWLALCAVMIVMLVLIGGVTRLTESGLSIVEWRPITGIIPPFNEAHWQKEFSLYQATPEYQLINKGMQLEDFKFIYYWEYSHRLLARLVGIIFIVPLIYFAWRKLLSRQMICLLTSIALLGGLQGFIGWYMVKSGLNVRPDVSHYRLALHLAMAMLLFALLYVATLQTIQTQQFRPIYISQIQKRLIKALPAVIFIQIIYGAFVAGLDAGLVYNTFPLMDGKFIPKGLWTLQPLLKNITENITTVQFIHRLLGMIVLSMCLSWRWYMINHEELNHPIQKASQALAWSVILQVALGIATLVLHVPIWLAACHQMGAVILFALSLWNLYLCQQNCSGTHNAT